MIKKRLRSNQQSRSLSRRQKSRRKHRNGKYKRPPETRTENTETKHQEQYYVTIRTREGRYEAGLIIDNTNNCPMQKKLNMARYRIPEHPRLMRNIPKFYTTKKLLHRQVRKFDIREPGPYQQLWHGGKLDPEHDPPRMYHRD